MDRLTKHLFKRTTRNNGIGCANFDGPECIKRGGNCTENCPWEEAAWERLAAYENTGIEPEEISSLFPHICKNCIGCELEPEDGHGCDGRDNFILSGRALDHIRELVEAEKDGRLVVLPCGVGDTVFCKSIFSECIAEKTVSAFVFDKWSGFVISADDRRFASDDIGKRLFFTREEAEAAVKEKSDENG